MPNLGRSGVVRRSPFRLILPVLGSQGVLRPVSPFGPFAIPVVSQVWTPVQKTGPAGPRTTVGDEEKFADRDTAKRDGEAVPEECYLEEMR